MSDSPTVSTRLIGEIFVERGLITHDQLEQALQIQRESGAMLGEVLVNTFGVSRIELASVLAEQWSELEREQSSPQYAPAESTAQAAVPIGFAPPQEHPVSAAGATADAADVAPKRPIGEIFVERGMITSEQLEHALELQRESGERLGEILVRLGVLERLDLAGALAEQWAGLQKLRPPSPTPPQPWQEMAVRQGAVLPADAAAVDVSDIREAVASLEQQVAAIAHRPDPDLTGVRAETRALEQRLAGLEASLGSLPELAPALAELQTSFAQLASWVEQTVGGDQEGVRAEIDRLAEAGAGAARASDVDALRSSFVAAESAVTVGFDELRRGLADVATRVESLAETTYAAPAVTADHITRPELDAALSAVSERISGLVESALQAHVPAPVDLSPLEHRLLELESRAAAFETAVPALELEPDPRLGELEHAVFALREQVQHAAAAEGTVAGAAELAALREHLAGVDATLAGLATQIDAPVDVATRTELTAFAGDVRARLDELAQAVASGPAAGEPDPRLDQLQARLDDVTQRLDTPPQADPRLDQLVAALDELRPVVADIAARDPGEDSDRVARDLSLNARADQLAERIETVGYAVDAGVAGLRAEIDQRLAALTAERAAVPSDETHARLAWLEQQVAENAERGPGDAVPAEVAATLAALEQRLGALPSVEAALGILQGHVAALDARVETLGQPAVAAEPTTVPEVVEQRLGAFASRAELNAAVTDLLTQVHAAHTLAASQGSDPALAAGLDAVAIEMREGLSHLGARLDELAAGAGHLGSRVGSLEHAAAAGNPEFAAVLDDLRRRVDHEAALNAERARVSERAIRKGLASLGERIVGTEETYLEAGAALRRSVERLGAAVIEADVRLAGEPVDPPTVGHVAFVPTKDGYRLQALPDAAPTVGELVEVEGAGQMRVVRVTISPLPLDRRPCVYLEPAS